MKNRGKDIETTEGFHIDNRFLMFFHKTYLPF